MATTGSDLPPDMVCCIAERADVGCRTRISAVCSLWRALVPAGLPQPWVLLQPAATTADDDGGDRESDLFRVLSLPANRELTLSPAFTSGCGVLGARCVGAGHGWLALVGADLSVALHNPFTGRSVSLPPLANHPMLKGGVRDDGTVLIRRELTDDDDTNLDHVMAEYVRDNLVRKIVFSPAPEQDDYFAVQLLVSHGENAPQYTMYARAGTTRWKTLRDKDGEPVKLVCDALHVKGGTFLAVRRGLGDVYQLDLAAQGGVDDEDAFVYNADNEEEDDDSDVYPPSFSKLAPQLYSRDASWYYPSWARGVHNHLVLVDGELYQVWAKWGEVPAPEDYVQYGVIKEAGVVKCDLDEHTYLEVDERELDSWAVLVGANETVAVRAGDMPGLRGSCVYFIDGNLENVACAFDLRTWGVEAVDCEMLQRAWPKGPWRGLSPQPVWFSPSYADAVAQGGSARPSRLSLPKGRHHERAQRNGVVSSEPTASVLKTRRSSGYMIMNQTAKTLMIN